MQRVHLAKFMSASVTLFAFLIISMVAGIAPASAHTLHPSTVSHTLFITSAHENADFSQATFPLHKAISHGETVYFVITDASDASVAKQLGVNYAPKIANARGTSAVQKFTLLDGQIGIPATVDFSPTRILEPGPTGFPPAQAAPGAVGEAGYSPLLELPNGVVLNAPQVANSSGLADKVTNIDLQRRTVTYRETTGFYDNHTVHYASFESSDKVAATIEDVTYAPNLNAAPSVGDESSKSSREGLIAFTNGQTGVDNPQRQGLSSAILDKLDPLNILHEIPPESADYSPLWDVRFAQWTQQAIANGQNLRQRDFDTVLNLVQQGLVTGFQGQPFGPVGFIVTCPVISEDITS